MSTNEFSIDKKATFEAVEKKLELAKLYKEILLNDNDDLDIRITPTYTERLHSNFTGTSMPVEDLAVRMVTVEEIARKAWEDVTAARMRLSDSKEKELLDLRYLSLEIMTTENIQDIMHVSSSFYHRIKNDMLYKLAISLGIIKYY